MANTTRYKTLNAYVDAVCLVVKVNPQRAIATYSAAKRGCVLCGTPMTDASAEQLECEPCKLNTLRPVESPAALAHKYAATYVDIEE